MQKLKSHKGTVVNNCKVCSPTSGCFQILNTTVSFSHSFSRNEAPDLMELFHARPPFFISLLTHRIHVV